MLIEAAGFVVASSLPTLQDASMITQSAAAAMEKHQRSSWCAWARMGSYAPAKARMRPRTDTGSQEIVMDEPCDWPDPSSWCIWR